jgi:hypothetical protein
MKSLLVLPFVLFACKITIDDVGINGEVSECGGFGEEAPKGPPSPTQEDTGYADPYCVDDLLSWTYDAEAQTLSVLNTGVFLNCCGVRGISVTQEDGVYVLTEKDEAEAGGDRCGCECVYDFKVDLPDLSEENITMKLVRAVDASSWILWQGRLNLSDGTGEVMIQARTGDCG